ncbi:hypothetical protein J2Y69_000156 [Microbacterium resistens]|uniref:Uncharacterized protein n=1 Tax=Microbacterium resistens TaxID=156977 RepID=A0ABU1S7J3_9MICO|nr:hypothetical protein [Microbacterium resistens]MDR6865574.1 hypothetical protein [Microbacterium resistens]
MTSHTDAHDASDAPLAETLRPLSAVDGLTVLPLDEAAGSCSGGFCTLPRPRTTAD